MIASGRILAISALTASALSTSTTTPSAPFSRSTFIPASLLVIPITSCLAATSAASNGLPMAPLAPATNTFIGCDLLLNTAISQRTARKLPSKSASAVWKGDNHSDCGFVGGTGGLQRQRLADAHVQMPILDKRNYHPFPPMPYQIATFGR